MMNPCSRNRNPRMKISRPRRQIASTAAPRLPVRCARARRGEDDGEAGEPEKQRRRKSAEHRWRRGTRSSGGRSAASTRRCVCASIISEHRDAARPVDVRAFYGTDVVCRRERDVLPHRMPDRAVLFVRERDGARDRVGGTSPSTVKCSVTLTMRCGSSGARSATRCARSARNGVASLRQDVGDVHRHAAGEREAERLHRRRTGDAGAVERHRRLVADARRT